MCCGADDDVSGIDRAAISVKEGLHRLGAVPLVLTITLSLSDT